MSYKPIIGVYSITHKPSGRVYVGASISIRRRWQYHRDALRGNRHENAPMQAAHDADGLDAFEFAILEIVAEKSALLNREQYWMNALGVTDAHRGFNVFPVAGSSKGHRFTPEQRAKVAASIRGRTHSDETRKKMSNSAMGNQRSKGKHHGKLDSDSVTEILCRVARGEMWGPIGADYDVSGATIGRIARRRIWTNVPLPEEIAHLFPMDVRGRRAVGSSAGRAKLTETDVLTIRHRIANGELVYVVAGDYGLAPATVSAIKLRRIWKHLS